MHDGSDPTGVTASSDHAEVAGLELDEVHNLAGVDVQPDAVVGLDQGVGVADGAPVRGVQVGDVLGAGLDSLHAAQLVLGLLVGDPVDGESALDVVDQAEVLVGLLDLDDVHEASGELGVGAHLAVDLDQTLLQDPLDLDGGERVLQAVSQEERDRHRLTAFVGSGGGLGRVHTSQLVQHP